MLEPMTEPSAPYTERPPVGNLTDFVVGINETNRLDIEVAIKQSGKVVVFHSHPFKKKFRGLSLTWLRTNWIL
jgi:hypothetical protein